MTRPSSATGFERLVDDYDAARPGYPEALYDALPPLAGRRVLELGAGTGKQTPGLLARGADVVSTDRGPRMLARLHASHPEVPVAVARAEALPFADASFDAVCGAQMWHWVDPDVTAAEVVRVLRPGGFLALWWNDVSADGEPWTGTWSRTLDWPLYERELRSKSYVAELPDEPAFLAAERTSLAQAFPDGRIVEPFRVRLWVARAPG